MRPGTWAQLACLLGGATALNAPMPAGSAAKRGEQHFTRVVDRAQALAARGVEELPITASYIVGTLAFNLAAHLVATREAAVALMVQPPTLFSAGVDANMHGLAWGLPAAFVVGAIELWRCSECGLPVDGTQEGCVLTEEADGPRYSALTNPVLVGTAPLAILSNIMLRDCTIGERAVSSAADASPRLLSPSTAAKLRFGASKASKRSA